MADVNIITEDFINSSAINSSALANAKKISKQGGFKKLCITADNTVNLTTHRLTVQVKHRFSAVPARADRYRANTVSHLCVNGQQRKHSQSMKCRRTLQGNVKK